MTAARDKGYRMTLRKLTSLAAAAGLAGSLALTAPAAAAPVTGVWRTDGYSSLLVIDRDRATTYQTTAISCIAGETETRVGEPGADGTLTFNSFTVRPERGGLIQHTAGSVGDRHLRRVSRLPASCTRPGAADPLSTFDIFWQTYAENYPFFAAKGIDWAAVRDRYRPRVRADNLFSTLVAMIEPLGDAHTGIRTGGEKDPQFVGHRPGTTFPTIELEGEIRPYLERVHGELRYFGSDRIGYRDLPGGLGYLRVIAFAGYTGSDDLDVAGDAAELDRALDAVLRPSLRGLIVDLRINGGGHDALGLHLASRLTGQPYLAYRKQARNDAHDPARFTPPQPIEVPVGPGPAYRGPVVLLTGGSQMSAGETFTMATFGRSPRPIRVGANTQGVFSDTLIRTLPNGWQFILPNERFLTRDGRAFDGAGIPPDIRTPVFTRAEMAAGRDSAFDRAVGLLHRR
jgi:hypothetical protein